MGLISKAIKKMEQNEGIFDPVELTESEIHTMSIHCVYVHDDHSTSWIEEGLKRNREIIRYLLGQLALVHEGVEQHELDSAFFKRYDGESWTSKGDFVIRLLNMGGQNNLCSFFKKDGKQMVNLRLADYLLKPTLSPNDKGFTAWYEKNGAKFEEEYAYTAGEIAYAKGDYERAVRLLA